MRGMRRMSVLVTGGAGYIGSHMVLELVGRGERVVVLDDLSTGFDWAVSPRAELVIGDIGDRVLLDRLIQSRGVETVMHFAGSVVVPEFRRRSARLLSEQHREVPRADRRGGRERRRRTSSSPPPPRSTACRT